MNEHDLMVKARRALTSANTLLTDGDNDGACNRAYYAMFDAARAALLTCKAPVPPEVAKTHSGLISAFSLYLVKTGIFPVALGKSLNKAEDLRLIADYKGDPLNEEEAKWVTQQATIFVEAITVQFFS